MSIPKLARFCLVATVVTFSVYSLQTGTSVAISGESVGSINALAIEDDSLFLNQTDFPALGSDFRSTEIENGEVLEDWYFTDRDQPRGPKCRGPKIR